MSAPLCRDCRYYSAPPAPPAVQEVRCVRRTRRVSDPVHGDRQEPIRITCRAERADLPALDQIGVSQNCGPAGRFFEPRPPVPAPPPVRFVKEGAVDWPAITLIAFAALIIIIVAGVRIYG